MQTVKKKLYIETSVWNQLEHTDRPDWRETAERFFEAVTEGYYEPYISVVVIDEILATKDKERQNKLSAHINRIQPILLEFDDEASSLSRKYMDAEFKNSSSQRIYRDCCHVAIATVNNIKHIVSFNCDHLVNDKKIDSFKVINIQNGYDNFIDISTPHKFHLDSNVEEEQ
jgi:predicted nucleic acid-binding protein